MEQQDNFSVLIAQKHHAVYAQQICDEMESSARERGTGIAKRTPEYITQKMEEGKAVIALTGSGVWAGFCYIEAWENKNFVANSGLIVAKPFRKSGLARLIKQRIFELSREKYPQAKIFGLTTGLAVMKINSDLGYVPVTYSELTTDEKFWNGCKSCVNYEILTSKNFKNCLCTGMLYDPQARKANAGSTAAKPAALQALPQEEMHFSFYSMIRHLKSVVRHGRETLSMLLHKNNKPVSSR